MVRKKCLNSGPAKWIEFQPGNGTKYTVLIAPSPEPEGGFSVCWAYSGSQGKGAVCYFRGQECGPLFYTYFEDKMGCRDADAAALLVLIHEETGRAVVLPPGYDAAGNYRDNGSVSIELRAASGE